MLSFDLCTLPSSACWHLLSGLSPHVPAIVSSTASGSSSSPTHYLSLMEERGGLFFFYGVRSVLSSTSSTLPLESRWWGTKSVGWLQGKLEKWVCGHENWVSQQRRAKEKPSISQQHWLPMTLSVPSLCVPSIKQAGPQGTCRMNLVEWEWIQSSLWTFPDFFS